MGFSFFFPVFSCSAGGFMRQLNKAVNAWGSQREPTLCVCACECVCTCTYACVCAHTCSRVLPPPGTSKHQAKPGSILKQIFPKNKARIKAANKREWLIPKPKPKLRHLSHRLTLIEPILMQSELNEHSIIYRLYMRYAAEEGRLCEQLQVWEQRGPRPSLDSHHTHQTAQWRKHRFVRTGGSDLRSSRGLDQLGSGRKIFLAQFTVCLHTLACFLEGGFNLSYHHGLSGKVAVAGN